MVAPPLLHANPSDFGVWLESRQDSPLSGVLLLRCKTETRGCSACVEAAHCPGRMSGNVTWSGLRGLQGEPKDLLPSPS